MSGKPNRHSRKTTRRLLFLLIVGTWLGIFLTQPAFGACGLPRSFTAVGSGLEYSYIYTPGFPFPNGLSTTDRFDGVFWSFGGGDPAIGLGNDMGGFGPFERGGPQSLDRLAA